MNRSRLLRVLATAVAVVAMGGPAACGDSGGVGGGKDAEQATDDGQPVTLKYWTWFPPEATVREAIAGFEKDHPTIKIDLRIFEAADYQKQLPLALNGGEELDVVGVQVSAMTNSVREQLRPVSEWEKNLPAGWRDKLAAGPVRQTEKIATDGKLYSIPMGSLGSAVMLYNAAMLSQLGIAVPTTADELATAAAKVRAAKPDVTPVVFSGEPYWQEEMLFTVAGQTNPTLSDDVFASRKPWNSPEMVAALGQYKSLFDKGIVGTDVLSLKGNRPAELFTGGKAAFYVDGTWQSSLLSQASRKANKIDLADVGAAAFPVVAAGGKPAVRSYAEGGLAIPKTSKHAAQAAKFVEYMTMGKGVDIWGKDLVLVPTSKSYHADSSVLASQAARDGYAAVTVLINSAGSARDSNQGFLNQVEGNAILDVLRGQSTAQAAADKLQSEWTSGRYTTK
ncbi:extracellular solute-binding protein [Dactylosporangium sp. NPDC049525]|uniref:ABC transporter substrate-binding protein n=1 Tax=Dactylosporangium sp. NPDC049525 TaxID=3154730 RepID=UPI003440D9EC